MKLGAILFVLAASAASAQTVTVNLCPGDTQTGGGTNFAAAMATGGDIIFAPACNLIHVTRSYVVSKRTTISGGNRVTIDSTVALGTNGMFIAAGTPELLFQQITLKPATAFGVVTGGQDASTSYVNFYQATVIGPALAAVSGVGSVSSVNSTFSNVTAALRANSVGFDNSQCRNCALAIESSASAQVTGSTFTGGGQAVVCESGTLNITGSHFSNLTSGAIETFCATTIGNSDFTGNKSSSGGAIAVNPLPPGVNPSNPGPQSSSISISATSFTGNSATTSGGAVSIRVSATAAPQVTLRHVVFDSNSADRGGALDISAWVLRGAVLDASGVVFTKNSAVHDGGAFHAANLAGSLGRAIFTNNKSGGAGGGVSFTLTAQRQFTVANSLFAGNTAVSGSAFSGPMAKFVNSTIAGNPGTAISVLQPPAPLVIIGRGPVNINVSLVSMANSIVANNGVNCAGFAGMTGPVVNDSGRNTQFPGNVCNSAIPTADPALDSMFVPAPGNPVLVGGDNSICAGPDVQSTDVWAQHRPRSRSCSEGAVEGAMDSLILQQNPGAVLPTANGDFTLSVAPAAQTLADSTAIGQFTVTVNPTGGFSSDVTFGVVNLPSGLSSSFSPPSGKSSYLMLINNPYVTPGSYAITITGTSGKLTRAVNVALVIKGPQ
jgi:predicted outer membrane repeat protein